MNIFYQNLAAACVVSSRVIRTNRVIAVAISIGLRWIWRKDIMVQLLTSHLKFERFASRSPSSRSRNIYYLQSFSVSIGQCLTLVLALLAIELEDYVPSILCFLAK
jgi:hypothetical protein